MATKLNLIKSVVVEISMKKSIFSIMLVLSMLFSLSVPAFAADTTLLTSPNNNTGIQERYSEAGELMKSLGIMVGYTDGQLHLENNISRAEFVTVIIRTLGYDYLLGAAENKFTDVPDNHWAKDYIALANALGYVQGVGNNKFNPDANVTIVEAEAVLLRILGYGDLAAKIGWPNGYTIYSSQLGMLENISIYNSVAATRGHISQLIANTLEVPFYSYFNKEDKTENILTTYMGYDVLEGVITDTALTNSDLEYNEVKVEKGIYTIDNSMAPSFIGEEVVGYIDDNGKILYLNLVNDENIFGFVDSKSSKKIEVDDVDYTFAKEYDVCVNNKKASMSNVALNTLVKVVLDEDGDVSAVYAYKFDKTNLVISDITTKNIKAFTYGTSGTTQYSIKDKQVLVYKDGKFGDVDMLAEEDIASVIADGDSLFFYVSDHESITGTLDSLSSKGAKIDGKVVPFADRVTYSINNNDTVKNVTTLSDLSALLDLEIVAVLDHNGDIIHIYAERADESVSIGVVIDKYTSGSKFVEIYDFIDDEYEIYYYTNRTNRYNDEPVNFEDLKVLGVSEGFSLVEITYSDEEITTITELDLSAETTVEDFYKSSIKTSDGVYYIDDDTVIIKADEGVDNLTVIEWEDLKNTSVNEDVKVVIVEDEYGIEAEYVFITDGYEYIGNDIQYGVVTSFGWSIYGDFYEVHTLNGEETIYLKNDAPEDVVIGDVIAFRLNIDELAVDVREIAKTTDVITYIVDETYIEFENASDFYEINEDALVFDLLIDGDIDEQYSSVYELERGDTVSYVLNAKNEVVYIERIATAD